MLRRNSATFGAGTDRQPLTMRPFVRSSRAETVKTLYQPREEVSRIRSVKKTEEVLPQCEFPKGEGFYFLRFSTSCAPATASRGVRIIPMSPQSR